MKSLAKKKLIYWILLPICCSILCYFSLRWIGVLPIHWTRYTSVQAHEIVAARVKIGDNRDIVLEAMLDSGAWYHGVCWYKEVVDDLYFFESKYGNQPIVWSIGSEKQNDKYIVFNVGTISDSMYLPEECSPPELGNGR